MKNVYDEIESFYNESKNFDPIIKQSLLEGYLRKKAWQGYNDDDLKAVWDALGWFINYLIYADIENLDEISKEEYIRMIIWISKNNEKFSLTEDTVCGFFENIKSFYVYLKNKKMIHDIQIIGKLTETFIDQGEFAIPNVNIEESIFEENFLKTETLSDDVANKLNVLLEDLLNKIGSYYKNEEFSFDFNRAISLYSGPFNTIPENDGEDFWLGFWDYFLFDYHLVESDSTPLRYFYETQKNMLGSDEHHILDDLLQAKFTVFYIHRIVNQYVVECINLFTDEKIQLPLPDYGMHDYKKIVFYGHIYSQGVVMLNYITSVPVSPKLRKRIKEEIVRQKNLYQIQNSNANIEAFFSRHAVVVRHTIDILVSLAKVNVISADLCLSEFPVIEQYNVPDESVTILLKSLAIRYKFSCHSAQLVLKMWNDFSNLRQDDKMRKEVIAGVILLSFSKINGMHFVSKKSVLSKLKFSEAELIDFDERISDVLQLKNFDPRYLSEEGFILSLYAF